MEHSELYNRDKKMLNNIDADLCFYSMGDQLTAKEATQLWTALHMLTNKFADIRDKAQARDWKED